MKKTMVRISQLAESLSMTQYHAVKFCERNNIPIAEAGARKIKMVSRDKFLEKLRQEKAYESIRKN